MSFLSDATFPASVPVLPAPLKITITHEGSTNTLRLSPKKIGKNGKWKIQGSLEFESGEWELLESEGCVFVEANELPVFGFDLKHGECEEAEHWGGFDVLLRDGVLILQEFENVWSGDSVETKKWEVPIVDGMTYALQRSESGCDGHHE